MELTIDKAILQDIINNLKRQLLCCDEEYHSSERDSLVKRLHEMYNIMDFIKSSKSGKWVFIED